MKTLLCIDDDNSSLVARQFVLESMGYRVYIADSGEGGLALLNSKNIDCVVLDYEMPEMDGLKVARRIRECWPQLPVVMLTGYLGDMPGPAIHLVDAFIAKGDGPEQLLQVIASQLQIGFAALSRQGLVADAGEQFSLLETPSSAKMG